MYTENDLRDAVAAGAISGEAADALRAHVAGARTMPMTDEETFRLVNSFNDIFVTIAAMLLLFAMSAMGEALWRVPEGPSPLAGALVAVCAWLLAEPFTRRRRMALPSIVLLVAFVGGVFAMLLGTILVLLEARGYFEQASGPEQPLLLALVAGAALATAASAWLHWRRFKVPITIAAGAAALVGTVVAIVLAVLEVGPGDEAESIIMPLVFLAGLGVFAYAMRWDISDRTRETRRSDVAFWLHLLAAPMIAHPLFNWIGVVDGRNIGAGAAAGVLAIYIAMALVALAADRRALLVSALAYVLIALTWLFDRFGAVELNVALTALVIGSALLSLSAFWTPIRSALVERLPGALQARLPLPGGSLAVMQPA
jgi:hypothetical protein